LTRNAFVFKFDCSGVKALNHARVQNPDSATAVFYETLEKLRDPSPVNENRLARLYSE